MKFSIEQEIELTNDEISFLREIFLQNRDRQYHILFKSGGSSYPPASTTLKSKLVVWEDNVGNLRLTPIGYKILNMIDRDKKINDILDGTKS